MRKPGIIVLAAVAIITSALAIALAACSSGSTHTVSKVAACKAAMTRDYRYALAHPDAPPAARPAACKGVPDATIRKLAAEIIAGG